MSRLHMPALFLISLPFLVLSSRVRIKEHSQSGPHKCSIHWEVPGRGIAKTSFPVNSCRVNCKLTFTDNHYNRKFPAAIKVEPDGTGRKGVQTCKCLQLDGTPIVNMHGDCNAAGAQAKCWEFYERLRTNEYTREFGKTTTRIIPHFELFDEPTFDYTVCEENACKDGDCLESVFPSIMEGRSEEEMSLLADILKRFKERGTVDEGAKELIDHLTREEMDAILGEDDSELQEKYDDAVQEAETSTSGPLTVGVLKEIYNRKLRGTGVSVPHLLRIAGLTDDEDEVDFAAFKRFLEPECP